MPTYYAPDLENRIINTEPIFGVNPQKEDFYPTASYAYNVTGSGTWDTTRKSDASSVDTYFKIINTFRKISLT